MQKNLLYYNDGVTSNRERDNRNEAEKVKNWMIRASTTEQEVMNIVVLHLIAAAFEYNITFYDVSQAIASEWVNTVTI